MKNFISELRTALIAMGILSSLLCGIYPIFIWAVAQIAFPAKANGSLIQAHGQTYGSFLLAQNFDSPAFFHPRPSHAGNGYDATSSGGSNFGPTSQKWVDLLAARVEAYRKLNGLPEKAVVPVDAVTGSASGLDPHISILNAHLQMNRIAHARNLPVTLLEDLVKKHTEGRDLGFLGEPVVNVMPLNWALENLQLAP